VRESRREKESRRREGAARGQQPPCLLMARAPGPGRSCPDAATWPGSVGEARRPPEVGAREGERWRW